MYICKGCGKEWTINTDGQPTRLVYFRFGPKDPPYTGDSNHVFDRCTIEQCPECIDRSLFN